MDSFDFDMRLPPRKRLLAGLKREGSYFHVLPPVPFISSNLSAQIRDVVNSPNSSPEDIIEVSRSVALSAAEIAKAARDTAIEKAAAAAKAKAAAKMALELLDSIAGSRTSKRSSLAKTKLRKKQLPIKLLYKTKHSAANRESDEELARKLHASMNSSPRISSCRRKNLAIEVVSENGAVCKRNLPIVEESDCQMNRRRDLDKLEVVPCPQAVSYESEEEETNQLAGKWDYGSKASYATPGRKPRLKRKTLPLSQFDVPEPVTEEPELDCTETNTGINDEKTSHDGGSSMKITSIWKCKKLKISQRSSDNKILPALC